MSAPPDSAAVSTSLTVAELVLLNNALNEVLHGVGIGEPEFGSRLGASRAEAELLLARLGRLVDECRANPTLCSG
jgi:hypothetical protein